jgi:hypothetical protein
MKMRSSKMRRFPLVEEPFAEELAALHRRLPNHLSGPYATERGKLYDVVRYYTDELNKVRKYACPLSTRTLLSSILEAVLLAQILEKSEAAAKSNLWQRAAQDSHRRSVIKGVPLLTFAELIQIASELGLLRTTGVQQRVDKLALESLPELRDLIKFQAWDAKRNREALHSLREVRNAVHPLEMIDKPLNKPTQFEETIWNGLRILLLINVMLEIRSPLNPVGA